MNVYGYARLSRDEDKNKESLNTQIDLIKDYAEENDFKIIKVFEDDNVSGYTYDRPALNELKELIDDGEVDVLIAKDLSRIGRNNAKTLLFLDYLEDNSVRLILTNEDYDSANDNDDMIGIKTWFNERYIKDISKKIKANIRQKQKKEGLVIIPHYGYMKDPFNKKKILVDEESAETVKLIFKLYLEGYGVRKIASYLNEKGYVTPSEHKKIKFGIPGRKSDTQQHLWYETSIRRIIHNDAYTGILRCGVTKVKGIKGKKLKTDESEHIIHENVYPQIISKEDFELVQEVAKSRLNNNVRAKNEKIHLYAGILECADCGKGFVARRYTSTKKNVYRCATYHRYGNEHCESHNISEEELNELIFNEIDSLINNAYINLDHVDQTIEERRKIQKNYERTIDKVQTQIFQRKDEIKNYARQLAKGLIDEEIFKELTEEGNQQLRILQDQLDNLTEMKEINANAKHNVAKSIDVLKKIKEKGLLANKDVNMLVDKIIIKQVSKTEKYKKPQLDVHIKVKAPFAYHEIALSCDDVILWINKFDNIFNNLDIAI